MVTAIVFDQAALATRVILNKLAEVVQALAVRHAGPATRHDLEQKFGKHVALCIYGDNTEDGECAQSEEDTAFFANLDNQYVHLYQPKLVEVSNPRQSTNTPKVASAELAVIQRAPLIRQQLARTSTRRCVAAAMSAVSRIGITGSYRVMRAEADGRSDRRPAFAAA
ncbi:hypothetical protein ACU8WE_00015 [Pseudomonas parakoreensis]